MSERLQVPLGVDVSVDIEERQLKGEGKPFRARARWTNPVTGKRDSKSVSFKTRELAEEWAQRIARLAERGIDPVQANLALSEYADLIPLDSGNSNLQIALEGLEEITLDPYLAGWRLRALPTLGHIPILSLTYGMIDRAVVRWIEEQGCGKSTIKKTLAVLGRVDVAGWQAHDPRDLRYTAHRRRAALRCRRCCSPVIATSLILRRSTSSCTAAPTNRCTPRWPAASAITAGLALPPEAGVGSDASGPDFTKTTARSTVSCRSSGPETRITANGNDSHFHLGSSHPTAVSRRSHVSSRR